MNWKEQLAHDFNTTEQPIFSLWGVNLDDYISTEIIKKLIADIPNEISLGTGNWSVKWLKQELRDKWL